MFEAERTQWRKIAGEPIHSRNCAGYDPMRDCTCGLAERMALAKALDALDAVDQAAEKTANVKEKDEA
jgi:hypothetical protein